MTKKANTSEEALNPAQQEAVDIKDGPVLVVAGAGTGKTRVVTERILRLIESGVPAGSILALTFTEKAAGEMLDRVSRHDLSLVTSVTIATFNGFGHELLDRFGVEWGLGNIRLLGETGQLVFLREHLDDLKLDYFAPVSNPDGQLKTLAGYVSLLKQQLVAPDRYDEYVSGLPDGDEAEQLEKAKHRELAGFFRAYLKICRDSQVIDYDDQLYQIIELLKARPNILAGLRQQYRYILVDEFQDTNPMQSVFVDLLAGEPANLMVVGDDDQSIYGWRGATLANILNFKKRYVRAREVTLLENYRSTQPILDSAYRLIQNNNPDRLEVINRLDKRLRAQSPSGEQPQIHRFSNFEAELRWIAEDVGRRLELGQPASSIAILARRRQGVEKVHQALELSGIPHTVAGLTNDIYQQSAVRQLIEALKTVADPLDNLALFHVLSGPLFGMSQAALSRLASQARDEFEPLVDVIRDSGEIEFIEALSAIDRWRTNSTSQTVGNLAYDVITDTGWKDQLYEAAQLDQMASIQLQALSKLFKTLKEFERVADVPSVHSYLVSLPALKAGGSDFEDASLQISDSEVNVLSVHRAKGLEWQTVYVADLTEGSFPLRNRGGSLILPDQLKVNDSEADDHLAEERRLMYVAMTRARNDLILTYSDFHDSTTKRRPSRFIDELSGSETDSSRQESEQVNLELFSPKASDNQSLPLPASIKPDSTILLSVSQITTWLDCPEDFYYRFILGMPSPPNPRQKYGTAIHAAIEKIHEGRRQNALPTYEEIWRSVKNSLPKAGYASPGTRQRDHQSAEESLKRLYQRFSQDPLPTESERPFSVTVPDLKLRIRGRFDAIYQTEGGIEIRDYKTSTSVKTDAQAKSRAVSSKQLSLYALAWLLEHGQLPAKLTLDFVETGRVGSVKKQAKTMTSLTQKLAKMVDDLNNGHYPPGSNHDYCSHPK